MTRQIRPKKSQGHLIHRAHVSMKAKAIIYDLLNLHTVYQKFTKLRQLKINIVLIFAPLI